MTTAGQASTLSGVIVAEFDSPPHSWTDRVFGDAAGGNSPESHYESAGVWKKTSDRWRCSLATLGL